MHSAIPQSQMCYNVNSKTVQVFSLFFVEKVSTLYKTSDAFVFTNRNSTKVDRHNSKNALNDLSFSFSYADWSVRCLVTKCKL